MHAHDAAQWTIKLCVPSNYVASISHGGHPSGTQILAEFLLWFHVGFLGWPLCPYFPWARTCCCIGVAVYPIYEHHCDMEWPSGSFIGLMWVVNNLPVPHPATLGALAPWWALMTCSLPGRGLLLAANIACILCTIVWEWPSQSCNFLLFYQYSLVAYWLGYSYQYQLCYWCNIILVSEVGLNLLFLV